MRERGYYDREVMRWKEREEGRKSGARLRPRVERFGEADQYGTAGAGNRRREPKKITKIEEMKEGMGRRSERDRSSCLELEGLGLLPGVGLVAEVTVRSGDLVDGPLEVELLDDRSRAEVPVGEDDLGKVLVGAATLDGSVRVDEDGEGLGDTDGVGELDEDTLGEVGVDERLGDPAGGVAVDERASVQFERRREREKVGTYAADLSTFDQSFPEKAPPP